MKILVNSGIRKMDRIGMRRSRKPCPARRIGRSREPQMKEFDQAVSELGSTVFENRRDSIRTVSLPTIKARESI